MYFVHGETGSPLYKCWVSLKQRCNNKSNVDYHLYGERGITVCEEWVSDYPAFKKWALENGYIKGLSLDRKDNDKGYNPDNCRWATTKQQNNNARFNRHLTINGKTQTIAEWAADPLCKVEPQTVYTRLYRGWKPYDAVFGPVRYRYVKSQEQVRKNS